MKSFTITINKTTLHGCITGNMDASTILVALHGGPGGNMQDMQKVSLCQELEKEYLVVYFDQRGCGKSTYDLRLGLSLDTLVDDVNTVIEEIKKKYPTIPIALLGVSYGGFLGFSFIEKHPTACTHYIACNPAITFSQKEAFAFALRNQERYQKRFPTLQPSCSDPTLSMTSSSFIDFVFSTQNTSHALRYVYAIKEWFFEKNFTSVLQNLTTPTIIQQGKLDTICDEKALHDAITSIQNPCLQYICLDTCSHDIDDIHGPLMARNIITFINQNIKFKGESL